MNRVSCGIPPDQDIHPCDYEELTDVPRGRCILWVLCYRARTPNVRNPAPRFDGSSCALPNDVAASSRHFGLGCVLIAIRVNGLCHAALAGGIGELSMIQGDGGLCRLRLDAYAGSGRLPW